MPDYKNFTSLPPEEEQQFVVFEERTNKSLKKAKFIGAIVALAVGAALVVNTLVHTPEKSFGEQQEERKTQKK